jgi:SWI/SNF-related matrix-associated actin-dependent regulator 1 of chromatin subfamily A
MVRPREFSSFWKYGMEWCGPTVGWGGRMDFSGASNLRGLHRRLKTFVIRRMKKDVLRDLPAKQRTVLPVDIKNRKEYDEAEENFLSWLLEKKGKAAFKRALRAEAVVKMGNLKQLAAQGKLPHVIEWIEDFLRSSTEKLLVFAIHKKMLGGLKKAFPKALLIDGSVSNNKRKGQTTSDRQRLIDLFQQGKRHRLLFCQLRAMGVGTTLTAASSVLKTELGWTPGEHEQGEDRVHRIGQKKQVHIYYMVGRKTIEERVLAVLQKKGEVTRRILDGKKGAVMRLLDMFLKEVQ